MPPKGRRQYNPISILLRDSSSGFSEAAFVSTTPNPNVLEITPRRDMLIGVQPGHVVTVGFGEEKATAEPETITVESSTDSISLVSRKGKPRDGTKVKHGPFKLADSMKPFWEKQGWVKRGESGETIRYTQADWSVEKVRLDAIKYLITSVFKNNPEKITKKNFTENSLEGLLSHYFSGSSYRAVAEAFPELGIMPWKMSKTPGGFFQVKENRIQAFRWLAEKLKKHPREITGVDLERNKLYSLERACKYNIHELIEEAFPELGMKPWEVMQVPRTLFDSKKMRISAVRWLVEEKEKKDPREIVGDMFDKHGLSGLINRRYGGSCYSAIAEAYPELDIKPWEMKGGVGKWNDDMLCEFVVWAEKKTGLKPTELSTKKLAKRLHVSITSEKLYEIVCKVHPELHLAPWEMLQVQKNFFKIKANRTTATRWLAKRLRKDPRQLKADDFQNNSLGGMLQSYYYQSVHKAINEAFP